jgi:predicted Zn-dependent protease
MSPSNLVSWARTLLFIVVVMGLTSCSIPRTPESSLPIQVFSDNNDIVLLPTEEFPLDFAANLAKVLGRDTGLRIRAVGNLGTRDWTPYNNVTQFDPTKLKDLASPAIEQLKKNYGGVVYILLTARDINDPSGNLRFLFSANYPQNKVSVISAARMLYGGPGQTASNEVVGNRIRKMSLRAIALLYYGLPRSADPQDLMYSPLMSLEALDTIQPVLNR